MTKIKKIFALLTAVIFLGSSQMAMAEETSTNTLDIKFKNVSVHDPSIINVDGTYYIVGSHLAFAKSDDLVNWKQLAVSVRKGNLLFPNPEESLKDIFDYAQTKTMWAGDMVKLKDGKYHYYFSACKGDQPLSVIGVATSDKVDGPYDNINVFLKSGSNQSTVKGYNATKDPNTVDPAVYFDTEGKFWMVYGSYSGGIYVLEMDENTGLPKEGQGWGKKILGGNHSRIEAPYIIYNKDTGYYYLFLSFGGLDYTGAYNVRIARSKSPNGPFYDAEGNDMIDCKGKQGSFFDDKTISKYGVKVLGNFTWDDKVEGSKSGYVSPGHNSAYFDKNTGKYFIIFHTRLVNQGEKHEIRVHEMKFNEDGWPVVMPFRYTAKDFENEKVTSISGEFKTIVDTEEITNVIKTPVKVAFNADGTVSGGVSGTWKVSEGNKLKVVVNGKTYSGFVEKQWNEYEKRIVTSFSVICNDGYGIWAYQ